MVRPQSLERCCDRQKEAVAAGANNSSEASQAMPTQQKLVSDVRQRAQRQTPGLAESSPVTFRAARSPSLDISRSLPSRRFHGRDSHVSYSRDLSAQGCSNGVRVWLGHRTCNEMHGSR